MKAITTLEEAEALPEKEQFSFKVTKRNGITIRAPYFRKIVAVELGGKAIMFFVDKDGRSMQIDYDEDGPFKHEAGVF